MAPAGELLKFGLQRASDWAGYSVADGAEVELPQAYNFSGGSADEDFVGDVELVAGYRLLDHGVTQIACYPQQAIAGDTLENGTASRSVNQIVAHQKDVLARTLGHVSLRIEHDGFVEPGALGFGLRQDRTHVISRNLGF